MWLLADLLSGGYVLTVLSVQKFMLWLSMNFKGFLLLGIHSASWSWIYLSLNRRSSWPLFLYFFSPTLSPPLRRIQLYDYLFACYCSTVLWDCLSYPQSTFCLPFSLGVLCGSVLKFTESSNIAIVELSTEGFVLAIACFHSLISWDISAMAAEKSLSEQHFTHPTPAYLFLFKLGYTEWLLGFICFKCFSCCNTLNSIWFLFLGCCCVVVSLPAVVATGPE